MSKFKTGDLVINIENYHVYTIVSISDDEKVHLTNEVQPGPVTLDYMFCGWDTDIKYLEKNFNLYSRKNEQV